MSKSLLTVVLVLFLATLTTSARAQRPADDWTALFERREGWLGADGIYSVDLNRDVKEASVHSDASPRTLFIFSDTIGGTTRSEGREYDRIAMTNHSFAILNSNEPAPEKTTFVWHKPGDARKPGERPDNIVEGRYWLQDGVRYGDRLWLTALLVGKGWKPDRVDALSFPLDPETLVPDFSRPRLDVNAPLSLRTDDAQIVMGAAICDDARDGCLYVFGYVDRFREFSRKDVVVARVPQDKLEAYDEWRFFNGHDWVADMNALFAREAALARGVSTEFSVSRIPGGQAAGKWLLVYTPGTMSPNCAFRVGDAPYGPFGRERVFWRSNVPEELEHVQCYNAKAHPIFCDERGVLTSYNVNRLGDVAKKPAEYRPRFVWLDWETIENAVVKRPNEASTSP